MRHHIFLLLFFVHSTCYASELVRASFLVAHTQKFLEHLLMNLNEKSDQYKSVNFWYHETKDRSPKNPARPLTTQTKFLVYLNNFIEQQENFLKTSCWLGAPISLNPQVLSTYETTQPFVIKYSLSADYTLFIRGDSHGDIQALSGYFYKLFKDNVIDENFKIKSSKNIFFFLGDLTDRGEHGIDTLALLFIFCLKNPRQVFIVRGNHEDFETIQSYGFLNQLKSFYADTSDLNIAQANIKIFFNLLPVAAFIGCNNNYFQFCHGGFEARYNPKNLLAAPNALCCEYARLTSHEVFTQDVLANPTKIGISVGILSQIDQHMPRASSTLFDAMLTKEHNIRPGDLGFLWSDFNAPTHHDTDTNLTLPSTRGAGLNMGRILVEKILKAYSNNIFATRGIIRAHQHNDTMPGLFKKENVGVYSLYDNTVFTTVGTSLYGVYPAYMKITLDSNFNKWKLTAYSFYDNIWHHKESLLDSWKNTVDF